MYVGCIDFRTAFDTINREIMTEKLESKEIKGKMVNMISSIYKETRNEVITDERITESSKQRRE